jgi:hypothetical protein
MANKDADIYFTLDGSDPTSYSTRYTGPIQLTGNAILKYRGFDGNWNPVMTDVYSDQPLSVTVTISGTGRGSINSSPAKISITGGTGSAAFDNGSSVTLLATAGAGSVFSGWSGACTGTGSCALTMDGSKAVTATFEALPYARISGIAPVYYPTLQDALDSAGAGDEVQARDLNFSENVLLDRPVPVSIQGGYQEGFGSLNGSTQIQGQLTVVSGSITVDRLVIR